MSRKIYLMTGSYLIIFQQLALALDHTSAALDSWHRDQTIPFKGMKQFGFDILEYELFICLTRKGPLGRDFCVLGSSISEQKVHMLLLEDSISSTASLPTHVLCIHSTSD